MKNTIICCLICSFSIINCAQPSTKVIIEQLLKTQWDTSELAEKLAPSHYITDQEVQNNTRPAKHQERILAGNRIAQKNEMVLANLRLIRSALEADKNITSYPAPNSGEVDLYFSDVGKNILAGTEIYIFKGQSWIPSQNHQIIAIRVARGTQSISHFYPIIGDPTQPLIK